MLLDFLRSFWRDFLGRSALAKNALNPPDGGGGGWSMLSVGTIMLGWLAAASGLR